MLQRLRSLRRYCCRDHFGRSWFVGLCGSALAAAALFWLGAGHAGQEKDKPKKSDDNTDIKKFLKSFSEPIRIQESKPVAVKDAQFVLIAQTNWQPAKPGNAFEPLVAPMVAPIEIQLRITNLGKGDVVFPTFQTFGIRVLNADGKEVKPRSIRKGDFSTRPVLIPGGASHSLSRRAELRSDEKTKACELTFYDGTGSESVIGPLAPGRYKLVCWYSAASPDEEAKQKIGDPATWVGEVATEEVLIDLADGTTRGRGKAPERPRWDFTEPLRIRESKPATKNDAKFVVAAQADWKPKKFSGVVPIEIQLRITNLSKNDLIFPTFDTFGLGVTDADGKRIMPRGGRDGTILTRPILLSAGASYSLGTDCLWNRLSRRAELHWNFEAKACELHYYDGTGTVSYFGPLEPGRYKLHFLYGVTANGPLRAERDPATWLGNAVTNDVFVEILGP